MSTTDSPQPYQPGEFGDRLDVEHRPSRPAMLTAVCVIAIVLGILGVFMGITASMALVFGERMQSAFAVAPDLDPELSQAQDDMNAANMEIIDRYRPIAIPLVLVRFLVAAGLIFGGVSALKLRDKGRKVLTSVFALAVVYEIVSSIIHVMQQLELIPVMAEYMPRIMESSAPGPGNAGGAEVGQAIAMVSIVLGIAMFAGMALVKLIFYIVGFVYLRKSHVVQLFQESV